MNPDLRLAARPAHGALRLRLSRVLEQWRRPLADDDVRAQFWVRHLRIGVALTMATSAMLAVYAVAVPGRPRPTLVLVVAVAAFLASPVLLRLPMQRMAQDHRGRPFFSTWSVAVTVMIAAAAAMDGGGGSLLVLLFSLTLSFAAVAYPPTGVAVLGAFMVLADVAVTAVGPSVPVAEAAVPAGVLAVFVVMATWTAHNQAEAHSQQVLLARTLEIEATTDSLTGCLNRRAFMLRLNAATRGGPGTTGKGAEHQSVGVCLIDLDGFKQVNDTLGHATGDTLLRSVAEALRGAVRESDTVARLGGDEFVVLTAAPPPPGELAERLRTAIAREGRAFGVTASVGVAISGPGDTAQDLLHRADTAMYDAKIAGGDRVA